MGQGLNTDALAKERWRTALVSMEWPTPALKTGGGARTKSWLNVRRHVSREQCSRKSPMQLCLPTRKQTYSSSSPKKPVPGLTMGSWVWEWRLTSAFRMRFRSQGRDTCFLYMFSLELIKDIEKYLLYDTLGSLLLEAIPNLMLTLLSE